MQQIVRIPQPVALEPFGVPAQHRSKIQDLPIQPLDASELGGQSLEYFRRDLILLKLFEHRTELRRKARQPSAGAKHFQLVPMSREQGPQDHEFSVVSKDAGSWLAQVIEHKGGQPL